jgi:hypothetical protein
MDNLYILKMVFCVCATALVFAASAQSVFPIVDQATQKIRDATRRHILVTELTTEKALLSGARTALASATPDKRAEAQKDVDLHAGNVQAINDELVAIGGAAKTVRVSAHMVTAPTAPKHTDAAQVPFWDVYRRPQTNDMPANEVDATAASN